MLHVGHCRYNCTCTCTCTCDVCMQTTICTTSGVETASHAGHIVNVW